MERCSTFVRQAVLFLALLAGTLFAAEGAKTAPFVAGTDSASAEPELSTGPQARRPFRIGFLYEIARFHRADLDYVLTRDGKRYDVDLDVSDMAGIVGRYGLNQWISVFGILGYQKFDVGYTPKASANAQKKKRFSVDNILLQANVEVGFSFLELKNYQLRLLGFCGGTFGFSIVGDSDFMNTPLYGYTRGVAFEVNIYRVEILAGLRSSHSYFHTYRNTAKNEDDYSLMLDFDTMSSPFFTIGIGF